MRGSASYKWISDRTQLQAGQPHTLNFRYLYDVQKETLINQQLGLDGLTGKPFKENDILHRHHIDYDKSNDSIENLILLTGSSHGRIHNPPSIRAERDKKLLTENKNDFINGIPPRNWDKNSKNQFKKRQIPRKDIRDFI